MMPLYNEAEISALTHTFSLHDPHYSPVDFTAADWCVFCVHIQKDSEIKRMVLKTDSGGDQIRAFHYSCLV